MGVLSKAIYIGVGVLFIFFIHISYMGLNCIERFEDDNTEIYDISKLIKNNLDISTDMRNILSSVDVDKHLKTVNEEKLKILNNETDELGRKLNINLNQKRGDFKLVYNPHYLNTFGVSRNYSINNKQSYEIGNKSINYPQSKNELDCFKHCVDDVNCVVANYDVENGKCIGTADFGNLKRDDGAISYFKKNTVNIHLNNGCLSYDDNNKKYDVVPCNLEDKNQKFMINKITNKEEYNSKIAFENAKINSDEITPFPFYSVNPDSNKTACLTVTKDNISIEPCIFNATQKLNVK